MKKRTTIILAAVMWLLALPHPSVGAPTANEVLCMVITHTDGTQSQFALCDEPVVSYQGEDLVVESSTGSLTTSLNDIERWTFEMSEINGIEETRPVSPETRFSFDHAVISGLQSGSRVSVYSIDGKALLQAVSDGEGHVSIDLGQLPGGVYIVRTPHQSYKIKK